MHDSGTMGHTAVDMRSMICMNHLICDVVHESSDGIVCIAALLFICALGTVGDHTRAYACALEADTHT